MADAAVARRRADSYAGVELGGTKVVVAVGSGPHDLREVERIPTTTPTETLGAVTAYLRRRGADEGRLAGIGVASFGPADITAGSPTYGRILTTPKPGWAGADVVATIAAAAPGTPIAFDTDVNGAALGEHRWGAGSGLTTGGLLYLTIGTGIGGGAVVGGRCLHGISHPEMGHIPIPHDRARDPYPGACPFHGDCFEGLAAGPAIGARWGTPAEDLPPTHEAWRLEADYVAAALHAFVLTLMPGRIVLGGGVSSAPGLLPMVRTELARRLGGYVSVPELSPEGLEAYVVNPALGDRAGVLGAIALCLG